MALSVTVVGKHGSPLHPIESALGTQAVPSPYGWRRWWWGVREAAVPLTLGTVSLLVPGRLGVWHQASGSGA
jgi:hypothetical protein